MRDAFKHPSYLHRKPAIAQLVEHLTVEIAGIRWSLVRFRVAGFFRRCKVHAVHLCFGSSNCFRPSLTVVPSQDWEGSCLAKGAAAALQCALLFSCLRTSGAAATFFALVAEPPPGGSESFARRRTRFCISPLSRTLGRALLFPR